MYSNRVPVELGTMYETGWKIHWLTHANSDGATRTYTRAAYILHRSLQRQLASAREDVVYYGWFRNPSGVRSPTPIMGMSELGGADRQRARG
jgi:hypothetical protein